MNEKEKKYGPKTMKRLAATVSIVVIVAAGLLSAAEDESSHTEADRGGRPEIALDVGVYLSGQSTTVAFVLSNTSREQFRTTPIRTNYNRLVIVAPDGKRTEDFNWKDGIPEVLVEPSESYVWKVDLARVAAFKKPGTYRVSWRIRDLESSEMIVVRGEQ